MINNNDIKFSIHEFLEGNLSESQTEELWAELLASPDDLEYLETLTTLKSMGQNGAFSSIDETPVYSLNNKTEQVHTGFFSSIRPYLVAASILIAGMLVLYNAFPPANFTSEITPISVIEYDIERSAEVATQFEYHLQQAVSYTASGDLNTAISELETARELELSDLQLTELEIVHGTIYYNSGEFANASIVFTSISNKDQIDTHNLEKSLWYLANSQIHLNQLEEARDNIKQVIELDGAFSRIAKNMIESF
ncbi:MAG: hypothetical protein JJU37_03075 [Balneolaceae bacterium]|nr:hypothetical protein [Balneolaceae bacterium]